jgi:hypothetical protein
MFADLRAPRMALVQPANTEGASMSIRKLMALAGLALAVAALSPASAPAKAGGTDRPVKGSGSGTASVDTTTLGTTGTLAITADATGFLTHLGLYTTHVELDGRLEVVGGQLLVVADGSQTVVVANGDEVTGDVHLTGPPPITPGVHEVTMVLTIIGGTGRFADASGTVRTDILASRKSFLNGILLEDIEYTNTGQISY